MDDNYLWHGHFEEQALLILTRSGKLTDVVTGEAPIESHASSSVGSTGEPIAKRRKVPRPGQPNKLHNEVGGLYTHNRQGRQLCPLRHSDQRKFHT